MIGIERSGMSSCFSVVILLVAAVLGGCASVTVKKVPSPGQYVIDGKSYWTREMQQEADKLEGFRFYLPRPFVNVFESFPVATDIYLARGRVSPDGKYVAIDSVMPLSTREDFTSSGSAARTLPGDLQIPQSWIFRPGTAAPAAGQARAATETDALPGQTLNALQGLVDEARDNAATAGEQSRQAKDAADQAAAAAGQAQAQGQSVTGQNRRGVTNDNGAFAYQPLRGNFDLVYLPDFDEQYVVSSRSGLGNAQFQMNLGQGWSLQGFNSFTDNSALTKRVFDVIDAGLELGKAAARAAAASAGIPLLGQARAGIEQPPADRQMAEAPGTPVSLKIVVVHYAAKGLYPVIKPRELGARGSAAMIMDLAAPVPTLRRPNDSDLERGLAEQARLERRSTVPVYPYQYVSFNTFRYMAIEVLTPQGAPFGTLYDKTGTTGEPGDRRATEPPRGTSVAPTAAPRDVLGNAVKALEADAIGVANRVIAETLKDKAADERPVAAAVTLELATDANGQPVVSGGLSWTGPDGAMTEELKAKIVDALDALIRDSADLKSHNQDKALRLSQGFSITQQGR